MLDHDEIIRLLKDRVNRSDFAISNRAQTALRRMGEAALPRLLEVITQPEVDNLQLHWEAVNALAEIGAAAAKPLFRWLTNPTLGSGTRWAVGEALGYLMEPAVPYLMLALGHIDRDVRRIAGYGLVCCRDPRAVPALLVALRDSDPQLSLSATKALKHLGDPTVIPDLHAALESGRCASPHAVRWAIRSLETLRASARADARA